MLTMRRRQLEPALQAEARATISRTLETIIRSMSRQCTTGFCAPTRSLTVAAQEPPCVSMRVGG
jgi:hypothetical protein